MTDRDTGKELRGRPGGRGDMTVRGLVYELGGWSG